MFNKMKSWQKKIEKYFVLSDSCVTSQPREEKYYTHLSEKGEKKFKSFFNELTPGSDKNIAFTQEERNFLVLAKILGAVITDRDLIISISLKSKPGREFKCDNEVIEFSKIYYSIIERMVTTVFNNESVVDINDNHCEKNLKRCSHYLNDERHVTRRVSDIAFKEITTFISQICTENQRRAYDECIKKPRLYGCIRPYMSKESLVSVINYSKVRSNYLAGVDNGVASTTSPNLSYIILFNKNHKILHRVVHPKEYDECNYEMDIVDFLLLRNNKGIRTLNAITRVGKLGYHMTAHDIEHISDNPVPLRMFSIISSFIKKGLPVGNIKACVDLYFKRKNCLIFDGVECPEKGFSDDIAKQWEDHSDRCREFKKLTERHAKSDDTMANTDITGNTETAMDLHAIRPNDILSTYMEDNLEFLKFGISRIIEDDPDTFLSNMNTSKYSQAEIDAICRVMTIVLALYSSENQHKSTGVIFTNFVTKCPPGRYNADEIFEIGLMMFEMQNYEIDSILPGSTYKNINADALKIIRTLVCATNLSSDTDISDLMGYVNSILITCADSIRNAIFDDLFLTSETYNGTSQSISANVYTDIRFRFPCNDIGINEIKIYLTEMSIIPKLNIITPYEMLADKLVKEDSPEEQIPLEEYSLTFEQIEKNGPQFLIDLSHYEIEDGIVKDRDFIHKTICTALCVIDAVGESALSIHTIELFLNPVIAYQLTEKNIYSVSDVSRRAEYRVVITIAPEYKPTEGKLCIYVNSGEKTNTKYNTIYNRDLIISGNDDSIDDTKACIRYKISHGYFDGSYMRQYLNRYIDSDDADIFLTYARSDYSIGQMYEIRQSLNDSLPIDEVRKYITSDIPAEQMRERRLELFNRISLNN